MINPLLIIALASLCVTSPLASAWAASIRNAYFSNGQTVPGQFYRSEGELPGPTKEFSKGTDKTARLFIVFGDLDAHTLSGALKAADGRIVSRMNRQLAAYTGSVNVRWRHFSHGFNLERLQPGEYQLELLVDDQPHGTYGFTLR